MLFISYTYFFNKTLLSYFFIVGFLWGTGASDYPEEGFSVNEVQKHDYLITSKGDKCKNKGELQRTMAV